MRKLGSKGEPLYDKYLYVFSGLFLGIAIMAFTNKISLLRTSRSAKSEVTDGHKSQIDRETASLLTVNMKDRTEKLVTYGTSDVI